jgi:hypothetical protein
MMSSSRITRYSTPSTFTSVPEYLPNSTFSPTLQVEHADLAVLEDLAIADGDDFTPDGLLGGGVRNHDATRRGLFFFEALYDHAVMQRTDLHGLSSP